MKSGDGGDEGWLAEMVVATWTAVLSGSGTS